jgi:prepilin-type N-terminal cleavage/methylation domain-containing protein
VSTWGELKSAGRTVPSRPREKGFSDFTSAERADVICGNHPFGRTSLRRGFTLVESVIAMTVLALAGGALLTSMVGAVNSCNDAVYRTVGRGLADQLMDEIAAAQFPTGVSSSPSSSSSVRSLFRTIDDYTGWKESPPQTKSGVILGMDQPSSSASTSMFMMGFTDSERPTAMRASSEFINRFSRTVIVERVQPATTGWTVVSQNTSYRRVTVQVSYSVGASSSQMVSEQMRVFAAVPPTP